MQNNRTNYLRIKWQVKQRMGAYIILKKQNGSAFFRCQSSIKEDVKFILFDQEEIHLLLSIIRIDDVRISVEVLRIFFLQTYNTVILIKSSNIIDIQIRVDKKINNVIIHFLFEMIQSFNGLSFQVVFMSQRSPAYLNFLFRYQSQLKISQTPLFFFKILLLVPIFLNLIFLGIAQFVFSVSHIQQEMRFATLGL
ncbi:unnamed protein product [Paramecium octaurelia]|uniref:Transmembrane protein n=1 Tax=Paramecium octaurelia TaxID=43137 RepID=A0A8S1WVJ2_PAROT|nr:unnamed protein product [Paramecium octaurelia]